MHLAGSKQAIRSRTFPGQTDVAYQGTGQPQLPARAGNQPGPPVGCLGVARANRRPAQRLLEEAERVLHREATQVPAPHYAQIKRQWTADPGQPQGPRWQLLVGQALHLNADDAKRSIRRTADVEVGPDINLDRAVERVIESRGPLRVSVTALVS